MNYLTCYIKIYLQYYIKLADSGCSVCHKPITDSTVITYRDKRCHKDCFKCSKCRNKLDLNGFKVQDV